MANGIIADRNRIPFGTVDATGWSTSAPASNAAILPLAIKCRSLAAGTDEAPVPLSGTFDGRYPVTYGGLFGANLRQADRVRLRLWADAARTELLFDTRDPVTGLDRRVVPNLYGWRQLRWGDPNLFRGDMAPEDFALYPTNVHVVVPLVRAQAWQWDLIGQGYKPDPEAPGSFIDAGYLEVGHAWLSDSLPFSINFAYGGADKYTPTDEIVRTPGGGVFVEPGTGYRSAEIPLELIRKPDGDRLFDLSKRVGWSQPVVWLPNVDDPALLFRYGFIGQRRDSFAKSWKHYRLDGAAVTIEEITT